MGGGVKSLRATGNDHVEGAGDRCELPGEVSIELAVQGQPKGTRAVDAETFDLQRADARNRAIDAQEQKQPGAEHLRRRDVLDGQHVEPMLGGVRASHGQSERPADDRGADHPEL
jgi:hypothetical protein